MSMLHFPEGESSSPVLSIFLLWWSQLSFYLGNLASLCCNPKTNLRVQSCYLDDFSVVKFSFPNLFFFLFLQAQASVLCRGPCKWWKRSIMLCQVFFTLVSVSHFLNLVIMYGANNSYWPWFESLLVRLICLCKQQLHHRKAIFFIPFNYIP